MNWHYTPLILPLIGTSVLSFALALLAVRRRVPAGIRPFAILALAMATWTLEYALEMGYTTQASKLFWAKLQFLSIAAVPVAWLCFTLHYTGHESWLPPRRLVLLCIIPVCTALLSVTTQLHGLIISGGILRSEGVATVLVRSFGPAFWVHTAYSYLLVLCGCFVLFRALLSWSHLYRGQLWALLAAGLAPLAGNAFYLLASPDALLVDPTPFIFALSLIAVAWAFFRGGVFDIVPAAHEAVIHSMREALFVLDVRGRIINLNATAAKLIGHEDTALLGKAAQDVLGGLALPLDPAPPAEPVRQAISLTVDGERRFYDFSLTPIRIKERLRGHLVLLHDISERKKKENALKESEARFKSAFEYAAHGIALVDLKGGFLSVNPYLCRMLGYSAAELLERNVKEITVPEDLPRDIARHRELVAGGLSHVWLEKRYLHKKGRHIWGLVSSSLVRDSDGTPSYIVAHIQNITDRKETEKALQASRENYRRLVENINDVIFSLDTQGNITYISPVIEQITGYKTDEVVGQPFQRFIYPEDLPGLQESLERTLSGEPEPYEFRVYNKDGAVRFIRSSSRLQTQNGHVTGLIGVFTDITDRKRAEEALQHSEERYRSLVENTRDGYFIFSLSDGRFQFLNQRICDLLGCSMDEGLNRNVWQIIAEAECDRFREMITLSTQRSELPKTPRLYTVRRPDGGTFVGEFTVAPVNYGGKAVIQGLLRDVTEQQRLQGQLQQAQKMEAIGTLSGGIAHDFNNILMAIQGNVSLMLATAGADHPHGEKLRNIETYVRNGSELTRQLLGFARSGDYEVKPTRLNRLVKRTALMFGRTNKNIRIHGEYAPDLWMVEADQGQLESVLLNIFVNAGQAMAGGGTLSVATENVHLDEYYRKPYRVASGPYCRISITDTGVGMDAETRSRIFEPFFTTKEMGRGTGLGLASAYGIVKNHKGYINVYSEKDHGTTFTIYLPASSAKAPAPEKEDRQETLSGSETILLIDDEKMILEVAGEILTQLGYDVLTASSGETALELYAREPGRIDLVLLDMIMPDMGGPEIYRRLKALDPQVRVLLASGFSQSHQATELLRKGCRGFIQKPFSMKKLSHKVREALEDRSD